MRAPTSLLIAVVLLALVAGGCGEDDDAPTKDEFIAQADEACVRGDEEIDQEAKRTFGDAEPNREEFEQFTLETVVPRVQTTIDEIRALPQPEGDEDQLNALLDSLQEDIDKVEEDPLVIRDPSSDLFVESDRIAREYGFEECGS